jgi:phospholipid N-methyltransferase
MHNRPKTRHPLKPTPDQWRFFRQWLKNPLAVAAISPSSQQLARQMIAELPPGARRVIELGGGTGVFTQALIDHGIAPQDMLVLELNEDLHHHLQQRFELAHVVCGDAMQLPLIAERSGYATGGLADAVLSGLGLLSMNRGTQRAIVEAAFASMLPEGRLIQFTYGPTCPVNKDVLAELNLKARRASLTLWNMPPATIYVMTRQRSKAITPTSMR